MTGMLEWCPLPLPQPQPSHGVQPAGLGQHQAPEGFTYLPCLCASPWASRLCRCGRLHGNNRKRESWDRRSWAGGWGHREGSVVGSTGSLQHYLLSHVWNGFTFFFFLPFYQRPVSGWAWRRVQRVGVTGACGRDRVKEESDDFCKVGCHWFWLPGKGPRQATRLPPPAAMASTAKGPGERPHCTGQGGLPGGLCQWRAQPSHLLTRGSWVFSWEENIFKVFQGEKKSKNLWKYLFLVSYCLPAGC